jgi:hypothetical protein
MPSPSAPVPDQRSSADAGGGGVHGEAGSGSGLLTRRPLRPRVSQSPTVGASRGDPRSAERRGQETLAERRAILAWLAARNVAFRSMLTPCRVGSAVPNSARGIDGGP